MIYSFQVFGGLYLHDAASFIRIYACQPLRLGIRVYYNRRESRVSHKLYAAREVQDWCGRGHGLF